MSKTSMMDDQIDHIDDHIDDHIETMEDVGNILKDLESEFEKEKLENEQANVKPVTSSSSHSFKGPAFSSSTNSSAKHSRSSNKHSNKNSNNNNNNINININESSTTNNYTPDIRQTNNSTIAGNITSNNANNGTSTRAVFKSSSDDRGELKMRITRETKPGKSEHKIVTSPNQKSPTSSSGSGIEHLYSDEINNSNYAHRQTSSSISSTKECGTSTSVGTITEPDCLGPCEPGTSVSLEGIVWQETEGGILVVNVTWRGKTYVGALLDCTKHDWAPPRLCDSPTSDIDSKANKSVRPKRIVTRSNGVGLDEKNLLQTTGKLRNGKGRRIPPSNEIAPSNKRQRESDKPSENPVAQTDAVAGLETASDIANSETRGVPIVVDTTLAPDCEPTKAKVNQVGEKTGPNSPMLIGCSEPNCSKKYRNENGLLYHKAHAHGSENETNKTADGDCSSSSQIQRDSPRVDSQLQHDDKVGQRNQDQTKEKNELLKSDKLPLETPALISDQKLSQRCETKQPLSPQVSSKYTSSKIDHACNDALLNHESRPNVTKSVPDPPERRNSQHVSGTPVNDKSRRTSPRPMMDFPPIQNNSINNNNNHHQHHQYQQQHQSMTSSKQLPSSKHSANHSNNPPPPADEGMKPSGTSTGPPPAPHQGNTYMNNVLAGLTFNSPYFLGQALPHIYPPTSSTSPMFMRNLRPPHPPAPESTLMIPKNPSFTNFKPEPNTLPIPNPHINIPSSLSMNLPPIGNQPPILPSISGGVSPHIRLPSQVDPMMPPTSQGPPFLQFPLNAGLTPFPPHLHAPLSRPPPPGMMEDQQAKRYPRNYN